MAFVEELVGWAESGGGSAWGERDSELEVWGGRGWEWVGWWRWECVGFGGSLCSPSHCWLLHHLYSVERERERERERWIWEQSLEGTRLVLLIMVLRGKLTHTFFFFGPFPFYLYWCCFYDLPIIIKVGLQNLLFWKLTLKFPISNLGHAKGNFEFSFV